MATTTPTYAFNTMTAGTEEDTWGGELNENWEKAEDLLDGTDQVDNIRWTSAALASLALTPDAGNMKTYTMTAPATFTDSLADGDWLVLHLTDADTHAPTWPTGEWLTGGAPAYTGADAIGIYKLGSSLFLSYMGPFA